MITSTLSVNAHRKFAAYKLPWRDPLGIPLNADTSYSMWSTYGLPVTGTLRTFDTLIPGLLRFTATPGLGHGTRDVVGRLAHLFEERVDLLCLKLSEEQTWSVETVVYAHSPVTLTYRGDNPIPAAAFDAVAIALAGADSQWANATRRATYVLDTYELVKEARTIRFG